MKRLLGLLLVILCVAGAVYAQEATETPADFGAVIGPASETRTPEPLATPGIATDDPRLATCAGPVLPNFVPYIVQPGDTLASLTVGADVVTVTQLAAINCLDDPNALPVGATIWIPQTSIGAGGPEEDASSDGAAPSIASLTAADDPVPNLEGTTFRWNADGAAAYFFPCPTEGECERPALANPLPVTHELMLGGFPYAGEARFRLEVDGDGETASQEISVEVVCSQVSLGPTTGRERCAEVPPLAVFGVWQPFEGGVMIYFSDTEEIFVMTNADQRVQVYEDIFEEGMEDVVYEDVPENRVAARRGFGAIWNQLGGPDSPLGWGLAEEIGYDSARQPAGRVSYTTYIQGPGETVYAVTMIPGTSTGYWAQVAG